MGLGGIKEGSSLRTDKIVALSVLSFIKSHSSLGLGGHDICLGGDILDVIGLSETLEVLSVRNGF